MSLVEVSRIASTRYSSDFRTPLADMDADADLDLLVGRRLLRNLHRQSDTPLLPFLGRAFAIDVHSRTGTPGGPGDVALVLASATPAQIPTPLGILGLGPPWLSLPAVAVPPTTGVASVSVRIPSAASLGGAVLYLQGRSSARRASLGSPTPQPTRCGRRVRSCAPAVMRHLVCGLQTSTEEGRYRSIARAGRTPRPAIVNSGKEPSRIAERWNLATPLKSPPRRTR